SLHSPPCDPTPLPPHDALPIWTFFMQYNAQEIILPDGFEALVRRVEELLARQGRVLAAIDGRCGSGKSTLAALLAARWDCTLVHADDFFLRPEQRTPQRLAQPGGNFDREIGRASCRGKCRTRMTEEE